MRSAARTPSGASGLRQLPPPRTTTSVPGPCQRTMPGDGRGAQRRGDVGRDHREEEPGGADRPADDPHRSPTPPRSGDEQGEAGRGDGQLPHPDLTERGGGRPLGHLADPPEQHTGGQVQRGGRAAADQAGADARGHPPDHHRPGRRHGQEVGGQRGKGQRAEGGEQQGRDAELRGDRHPEGVGAPRGAGAAPRSPPGRA